MKSLLLGLVLLISLVATTAVADEKMTFHYASLYDDQTYYIMLVPVIPIDRDKLENELLKIKHVGQAILVHGPVDTVIQVRAKTTRDIVSKDWNLDSVTAEVIKVLQSQLKGHRFEMGKPIAHSKESAAAPPVFDRVSNPDVHVTFQDYVDFDKTVVVRFQYEGQTKQWTKAEMYSLETILGQYIKTAKVYLVNNNSIIFQEVKGKPLDIAREAANVVQDILLPQHIFLPPREVDR